ncbi:MAG: GNAT family N-acetyltransferase [Bacteroidota bacterium]
MCYSAENDHRAEVDIYTFEQYRGKNLAKIAASAFIMKCKINNIIPNWDCFADNIASVKIAQSLGFKITDEYTLLSIYKL